MTSQKENIEKIKANHYIELNSSYRNRLLYPNVANFIVEVGQPNQGTSALDSVDPIVNSYPTTIFTHNSRVTSGSYTGGNPGRVQLDAAAATLASNTDDYYKGAKIVDVATGEQTFIQSYDAQSNTALLYFPFSSDTWSAGGTYQIQDISDTSHIYDPTAPNIDGYNVGNFLYNADLDEFRTIISFDSVVQVYTVDSAFSGITNDTFEVRKSKYISNGTSTAFTNDTITLAVTEPSKDDTYKGYFVRITSGVSENETRLITAYDGTTKVASFNPPITSAAGTPTYEVLQWTRDNVGYIDYYGSGNTQQGLYEVELLDLVLPNVVLNNNVGGRIAFYPYVYVEFSNTTQGTNNIISSNNPNSSLAVFRCPITDTNSPLISTFIKVDSNYMKQVINFNPMLDLKFKVFLSDGTLFDPAESENFSPLEPNSNIQISALFRYTKI